MDTLLRSPTKMCLKNFNVMDSSNDTCDSSVEECGKDECSNHEVEMAESVDCSGNVKKKSRETNSKCKIFTIDNILGLDSGVEKSEDDNECRTSAEIEYVKPTPFLMEGLSSMNGELVL
jgi:hypothetical protein